MVSPASSARSSRSPGSVWWLVSRSTDSSRIRKLLGGGPPAPTAPSSVAVGGVPSVFMLQNTTSALGVYPIFALTVVLTCANGIDLVKQGTTIHFTMRCKRWTWNTANGTRLLDQ